MLLRIEKTLNTTGRCYEGGRCRTSCVWFQVVLGECRISGPVQFRALRDSSTPVRIEVSHEGCRHSRTIDRREATVRLLTAPEGRTIPETGFELELSVSLPVTTTNIPSIGGIGKYLYDLTLFRRSFDGKSFQGRPNGLQRRGPWTRKTGLAILSPITISCSS